jgi:hypothetical protein
MYLVCSKLQWIPRQDNMNLWRTRRVESNNLQTLINQISIRDNLLIRVWRGTRGHIHNELFNNGFHVWGLPFEANDLSYQIGKLSHLLSHKFIFIFVQAELSYLLLIYLGRGWHLGVVLYFFYKWKTCNVAKLINMICMRKNKR